MLDLRNLYYSDRDDGGAQLDTSTEHQTRGPVNTLLFAANSAVVGNIGAALTPFGGLCDEYDATNSVDQDGSGLEGDRVEAEHDEVSAGLSAVEEREWYDEEPRVFVRDPFGEGLRRGMREQH